MLSDDNKERITKAIEVAKVLSPFLPLVSLLFPILVNFPSSTRLPLPLYGTGTFD